MIEALAGVLLGGVITLVVAWIFYVRAARGLEREAEKLRTHTNLIIRALDNAELAEVRWNEQGEPVGLVIKASVAVSSRSSVSITPTVQREEEVDDG